MMQRILSIARSVISKPLFSTNILNTSVAKYSILHKVCSEKLLRASIPMITPICNLKVKGKVKRRCRSCYLVYRQERLFVMCHEHPRHKQVQRAPKPLNTWILTHASQSKIRPW